MDVHPFLSNAATILDRDGCNGAIRPCETSDTIFPLECDEADMTVFRDAEGVLVFFQFILQSSLLGECWVLLGILPLLDDS